MTTGIFKYIDPNTVGDSTIPSAKSWTKVDGGGTSFSLKDYERNVINIRGRESEYTTDSAGFSTHISPAAEKLFTEDEAIRGPYYDSVKEALKKNLPSGDKIKKVVIFDHTVRRRIKGSARQPVQQVHVDQTPGAAELRVRRHAPAEEIDELLSKRYQLINVWRPIENPASDFPLAVIDWRSTQLDDYVPVDLLYPKEKAASENKYDNRGKEVAPTSISDHDDEGYEVKGETFAVKPNDSHRWHYVKDMTPDEVMFIKCFDSKSETLLGDSGKGIAHCVPHTAFIDPNTPANAPGRQSIEVRCLVFYDE